MAGVPPPRKIAAFLWNHLPLPFSRMAVRVEERAPPPAGHLPLNKVCDRLDWEHPDWRQALEDLGYAYDPARLHRKHWEFAQAVYGLRRLRCLASDAAALGLACGHEPIIFFLAGRLRKVIATDLYAGEFSQREADPRMLRDPDAFAALPYPRERLEARRMDATRIDYPEASFDIVFSFSSLEHFGSRRTQRRTLVEIGRVLRPGGVAVITTEIILNRWGRHGDYFRPEELLADLVPRSGLRLAGGDFDFSTSRATLEGVVRLPGEVDRLPHLVLRRWRTSFTSCALFLEKPIPPGLPHAAWARRGNERPVSLPPMLSARLTVTAAPTAVARSTEYAVACHVQNAGHARWPHSAPDGFGLVRLGAHLDGGDGTRLIHDYGRAELGRDMAPGEEDVVTIGLRAPDEPGDYRVELDMVREGIAWFSARRSPTAVVRLTVT